MRLEEEVYLEGLMQWAADKMGTINDFGQAVFSNQAKGRLDMRAATNHLIKDWKQFCGQRNKAGVRGYDAYDPTINEITHFLRQRYNINLNLGSVDEIADAAKEAGVEEGPPADLKATSRDEYDKLKQMATGDDVSANPSSKKAATKPTDPRKASLHADMEAEVDNERQQGLTVKESLLMEDGNALRKLFGTIALHLWDTGLLSVERGTRGKRNVTDRLGNRPVDGMGARGGDTTEYTFDGTEVDTAIDDGGNYVDAKVLRQRLIAMDVDSQMIKRLQTVLKPEVKLRSIYDYADDDDRREMVAIAAAMVSSIRQSKNTMPAGQNMTADGNTINFKVMKASLKKYGIKSTHISRVSTALQQVAQDNEITDVEVARLMKSDETVGRTILGLMASTVKSIQKVNKNTDDDDDE